MGRPKQGQAVQEFRALTERMKDKRQRIRPEFVPELAAWLVLHGERYTTARVRLEQIFRASSNEDVHEQIKRMKAYEHVIQQLCNTVADPWSVVDWCAITERVANALGIKNGEPVPDTAAADAAKLEILTPKG